MHPSSLAALFPLSVHPFSLLSMRPSTLAVPFLSRCTRWRAARIESGEENEEKDDQRYESKEERRRETGRKERRDRVRLSRGVERQKRGW